MLQAEMLAVSNFLSFRKVKVEANPTQIDQNIFMDLEPPKIKEANSHLINIWVLNTQILESFLMLKHSC